MVKKIKIQLTEQQTNYLMKLPENGMGYQIVDIVLKNGKVISEKIIINSTYLQLEQGEAINPDDIDLIRLHKK